MRQFNLLDLDDRLLRPLQDNESVPNKVADFDLFCAREEIWGRPGPERERYFAVVDKVCSDLAEEIRWLRQLQEACKSVDIVPEAFTTSGIVVTDTQMPGWSQICRTSMVGFACLYYQCWEWEEFKYDVNWDDLLAGIEELSELEDMEGDS